MDQLYSSEPTYSSLDIGKPIDSLTYTGTYAPYYIKRMNVHLPDGSSHELRKDDDPHEFNGQVAFDATGKYYAVDGSRLMYDFATETLWLPDGSRYIFTGSSNYFPVLDRYIDRNGNTLDYDAPNRQWTDALGRVISEVLPAESFVDGIMQVAPGLQTYNVTGVGGSQLQYKLRWKKLQGATEAESALTDWQQTLPYDGITDCRTTSLQPPQMSPYLFGNGDVQGEFVCAYLGARFNPTVLAEVELPNGTKYEFKYNVYGEIERINYPTGGFETFTYDDLLPIGVETSPMYDQTNRGVIARNVKTSEGASDQIWTYQTIVGHTPYTVKTTAPDGSYTERLLHRNGYNFYIQFGFDTPLAGMAYDERSYAANNQMLRRKLTEWQTSVGGNWGAQRDARVTKEVELILDTGTNALATTTTYSHDTDENVTGTNKHAFVAVDQSTAQNGGIGAMPTGSLLRSDEATYLVNDAGIAQGTRDAYRARNMLGLPVMTRTLNASAQQVSRGEMRYDEAGYPLLTYGSVAGWTDPQTSVRGNATTSRAWVDTTNTLLETHATYDQVGNVVQTWDAKGNTSAVSYADRFSDSINRNTYAFPTSTTSAVPDPTNFYGTNTPLTSSTVYDVSTGLPTQTTDANGVVSEVKYTDPDTGQIDPLNRARQVIRAVGVAGVQSQTKTTYDDVNRTVTVESDLNTYNDKTLKSQSFHDGLGRTTETRSYESTSGYIAARTEYDQMGRTKRTSNPFRPASESPQWTTPTYDALGRVLTVTTPDGARVTTSYSGTTVTVTDQAGKSRRSETDALGRLTSVWEDPAGLNYQTTYLYDVLGNLRKVDQGNQQRYFAYDSLSRLIRAKNPEQATNTNLNYTDPVTGYSGWSLAYTYDANGNVLTKRDARNVTVNYTYDALNRNTYVSYTNNPAGTLPYSRSYDYASYGRGRFYETYTSGSNATDPSVLGYDPMGRPLVRRTWFMTGGGWSYYDVRYAYDLAGNVKTITYPTGRTVNYSYDGAGRTRSVAGNLGDDVARTYADEVSYSPLGGIAREKFGTQTPLYHNNHYNVRGQLDDVRLGTNGADVESHDRGALLMHYLLNGNVRRTDHHTGTGSYWHQDYTYDGLNRLSSATDQQNGGVAQVKQTYVYDRWGNRTLDLDPTKTWGAGVNTKAFTVATATNRLGVPSGQAGVMTYDAAGNLTSDTYTGVGTLTYDAESRMVQAANASGTSTYGYDGDGRRTRRLVAGVEVFLIYGAGGELLAEYSTAPSLRKEYAYRGGEMLVVLDAPNTTGGLLGEYFNGMNFESLVTSRTDAQVNFYWNYDAPASGVGADYFSARWTGTLTPRYTQSYTFYAWADDAVRVWVDGQLIINRWTYSPDETASAAINLQAGRKYAIRVEMYEGVGGAGAVLSWSSASQAKEVVPSSQLSAGAQPKWIVTDHLGTPRIIVDETGGLSTTRRHDYAPFGEELYAGTGGRTTGQGYSQFDGVRQGFTGYEKDAETGLNFAQSRYHSPTMGRFTSPDEPFADQWEDDPQSWNLYSYVRNNPLVFTDPTGMWRWVDPDNNGNRFLQWEEGDDWKTLATFLNTETNNNYRASDLERDFGSGGLGDGVIVDVTGTRARFTSVRGTEDVSFELFTNIMPAGRGAKIGGGLLSRIISGAKGLFSRKAATGVARKTVKEISEELGYFPTPAVKEALIGRAARESIPAAERELAAKFYERVANEVVSGTKESAGKALNLARAKFLREGGSPPVNLRNFEQ